VFLTQNQAFSNQTKQKNIFAGLEAFFVPKMAQDTSLRGGKSRPGRPKYLQGAAAPPALPLPGPMWCY